MSKKRSSVMGRGLGSLLENPETDITSKNDVQGRYVVGAISELSVENIEANPFQPRDEFDRQALEELSASIKIHGLIQPITVRKLGYDKYQLISGERRFIASKLAGLEHIPAYIRIADDEQMLEWALIENIHREGLNPVAIAHSFQRLIDECNITQEELSKKVSMSRPAITNHLRLLKLPAEVQQMLRNGQLSMGHARAVISIENAADQVEFCEMIVKEQLSVREVEKVVKKFLAGKKNTIKEKSSKTKVLPDMEPYRKSISNKLNSSVMIKYGNKGRGSIVITFNSEVELKDIVSKIG